MGDGGFVGGVPGLAVVAAGFVSFFGLLAVVFDRAAGSSDVGESSAAGCGAVCAGELAAGIADLGDGDVAVTTEPGGGVATGGGIAGATSTGGGGDVGAATTGRDGCAGTAVGSFPIGSGAAAGTVFGGPSDRALGAGSSAFCHRG